MTPGPDGRPGYLPFEPNRLGAINFHFNQWVKTPAPALPPYRAERSAN
jgi:hypothetical protein